MPTNAAHSSHQPLRMPIKRRSFLQYAGATAGVTALALAGCKKDDPTTTTTSTLNLGSGDIGLLNYIFVLKQLEATFYQMVKDAIASTTPPTPSFSAAEAAYLTQVATHEAIHRDIIKTVINRDAAAQVLPNLTTDFSTIDFKSRASILDAAVLLEDLGVAACNGAGHLLKTQKYVVLAGQIVSVEARHAAYVRDLVSPGTFADTADANGLDQQKPPAMVMTAIQKYIKETLDASTIGQ